MGLRRLYNAICFYLEATAMQRMAEAEGREPVPEGAGGSQVEHAHSFTSEPELHAGWQPSHFGWDDQNHISLRWHPKG
jgi:hypothetical protein